VTATNGINRIVETKAEISSGMIAIAEKLAAEVNAA